VNIQFATNDGSVSIHNPNYFGNLNGTAVFTGEGAVATTGMGYTIGLTSNPGSMFGSALGETDTIAFSINVSNTSDSFRQITLVIQAGLVNPWFDGTLIGATVSGTLTDLNGGGASMTNLGNNALMTPLIDGTPVLQLATSPFSVTAPASGATAFSFTEGLPGPTIAGPMQVLANYGLVLQFTLGAGDRVDIGGTFEILYIPGPGALALLAIATATTSRRRRN
jgi:hypothetical protein